MRRRHRRPILESMTYLLLYLAYATGLLIVLSSRGVTSRVAVPGVQIPVTSKVLIVGATGGTGRALVLQALARQLQVTALVREPARLGFTHPSLTMIRGDVRSLATVQAAVRGQDAVICALGHRRFFYPTRILSVGTRNLLRAMEAHGVRRFVCQTSLGIGSSAGRMGLYYTLFVIPVVLPFYFWDKSRQERLIADSKAEWVIVRPVALTHAAATGQCRHGFDIGSLMLTRRIARDDVARFMLDQLSSNQYLFRAVGVSA